MWTAYTNLEWRASSVNSYQAVAWEMGLLGLGPMRKEQLNTSFTDDLAEEEEVLQQVPRQSQLMRCQPV